MLARVLVLGVVVLGGTPSWGVAATPTGDATGFFDQCLGDYSEELAVAEEQGKAGVLLFFEMDECPFCHRMKKTVLNQPQVQAYFREHFLVCAVDVEGDVQITDFNGSTLSEKQFAFDNRVRATPVFAFFGTDGNVMTRYTGATVDATEFMWLGQYVVEGIYRDMSFTRYKRQRKNSGS